MRMGVKFPTTGGRELHFDHERRDGVAGAGRGWRGAWLEAGAWLSAVGRGYERKATAGRGMAASRRRTRGLPRASVTGRRRAITRRGGHRLDVGRRIRPVEQDDRTQTDQPDHHADEQAEGGVRPDQTEQEEQRIEAEEHGGDDPSPTPAATVHLRHPDPQTYTDQPEKYEKSYGEVGGGVYLAVRQARVVSLDRALHARDRG